MTRNCRGFFKVLVLITAIAGFVLPAQAGWIEVDKSGDKSLSSEGREKEIPQDKSQEWDMHDINKGIITSVDPTNKAYTEATLDEMCKVYKKIGEDMGKATSPQQRAMMEQMMAMQPKEPPKVFVKNAGKSDTIAGFKTTKYIVTANGKPFSELWITTNASPLKDITKYGKKKNIYAQKMAKCMAAMGGFMASMSNSPEFSPEYLKIKDEKGWVLREIKYEGENFPVFETDVVKLEKRKIPGSEFNPPAGYKKLTYLEWMRAHMQ